VAARGEAKVESKQGYMEVEVEFDNLQSATRFGPEFLTYVMWAITPEGRATNMGEVILNGTKSKLDVTTELQAFGLSAEGSPGLWPRWRGDGKELFFVVAPNIVAADIKVTGSSVQPGVPHILFPIGTNPVVTAHTLVSLRRHAGRPAVPGPPVSRCTFRRWRFSRRICRVRRSTCRRFAGCKHRFRERCP
jgi:hypothetical protein